MRCSTPGNVLSASAIALVGNPAARPAAMAAAAFSRLCTPGIRGSAGSTSPPANSTRRPAPALHETARHDCDIGRHLVRNIRSFASRYASNEPWRSMWSGSRLSRTAIPALQRLDVLELERRQLTDDPGVVPPRSTSLVSGRPDVPDDLSGSAGGVEHRAEHAVVVVLPFVPVTPRIGFVSRRAPSSISREITGTPALARRDNRWRITGNAGALDDELDAEEERIAPLAAQDLTLDSGDVEILARVVPDDVAARAR